MRLSTDLPFVDRSGMPEHARPVRYSPFHTLDDLERHAWAANDRATLEVIELAEEAAGIEAERVCERRAELLCDARGVTAMRAELADAKAEAIELRRQLAVQRSIVDAVRFVLRPHIGTTWAPKRPAAAPKWADHLIRALARAEAEDKRERQR